ncbi:MAG TPA: response regulator [Phycisphaerales bacterium]|nr:response regulator [Phycisphaerales bacterium]
MKENDPKKDIVILIAEDEKGHFLLTKRYLRKLGIRNKIIRLKDGQDTLDFLCGNGQALPADIGKKHLLLLDIHMPRVDGIAVLERIRKDQRLQDMPVVMLTTSESHHEMESCHAFGCNAYIVKPLKYESYIATMRKIGLFPSLVRDGFMLIPKETAPKENAGV